MVDLKKRKEETETKVSNLFPSREGGPDSRKEKNRNVRNSKLLSYLTRVGE